MRTRSIGISLVVLVLLLSTPVFAGPATRDGDSVWLRSFRALERIVHRLFVPIPNNDGAIPPIP